MEIGDATIRGGRKPAASSDKNTKNDDCNITIERILSAIEERGECRNPRHGPLTNSEIGKLSMLCAQQTDRVNGNKSNSSNNRSLSVDGNLNDDLGFADVDADIMVELVEYLEKHVALASGVDLVQSSYETIRQLKIEDCKNENGGCSNIEEVRPIRRSGWFWLKTIK